MQPGTEAFQHEILDWVLATAGERQGFLVGLNAPQGAGKSTLTAALCRLLADKGKRAVTLSVDDFYLTRSEQVALAQANPANPYLQQRGYPGTHDVALGARVLRALKSEAPGQVRVPRYDKSQHQGQGDREPEGRWTVVETPVDILFLEGWMLGFTPVPASRVPDPALGRINEELVAYAAWYRELDAFLQLEPADPHFVLSWRVEAEEKMKASGKPGMSETEIRAYVEKFLPAYSLYLPWLRENPPASVPCLVHRIGKNRMPF